MIQRLLILLIGLAGSTAPAIEPLKYDFGASSLKPAKGYTRVSHEHTYTKRRGFGLIPNHKKERGTRYRAGGKDRRHSTFVFDDDGTTFVQDLPNGTYYVTLVTGDLIYPSKTSVSLNGVSVVLRTQTRLGELVQVNGAKVQVRNGKLRVHIGGWGQLCYLEIVPADSRQGKLLQANERSRQLVRRLNPIPRPPQKTEADNTGTWVCIGPWHFPENWIWIYPTFPNNLQASNKPIRHGWGLYLHLPAEKAPFARGYHARVSLRAITDSKPQLRKLILAKRIPMKFRRVFQTRPYHHDAYESLVELLTPFQDRLKKSNKITYQLTVHVENGKGEVIRSHSIRFANRPTYLLSNIKLARRGMESGRFGVRSKVNIGDLTGDGNCDFVYCISATYKAAYSSRGKLLWQYADKSEPSVYNSMATRVFDIDGDGRAEVICLQQGQLRILDGRNGKVKRAIRWPDLEGRPTGLEARIFFANLRGQGVRDIVVLNGYANQPSVKIVALSDKLKRLWDASGFFENNGVGSHCLNVADVDNDGRDEIAFGTSMVDHDGKLMWRLPYKPLFNKGGGDIDHVDEAEVADVDGDGKLEILYASGTLLDARTGKPYFSKLPAVNNGQWVRIDKVRLNQPGQQLIISNKWSAPQLFNKQGKQLKWPFPFAGWDLIDWDGDGKTEIMGGGLICDRRGVVIGVCDPRWTMPQYGDITGNGREEAIPWCLDVHGQQIRVFSSAPRPSKRSKPLVIRRRHYNFRD